MSPATSRRLAWALAAIGLGLTAAGYALAFEAGTGQHLITAINTLVFGGLCVVIVRHQPRNAIGWIFGAVALTTGTGTLARGYAEFWLDGGSGPDLLGKTAAVVENAGWVPNVVLPTTLLLLLFPDGRLPGRRWRGVGVCAVVGILGVFLSEALKPGPVDDFPSVVNPFGIDRAAADALSASFLPFIVGVIGSAASLVVRYRRAAPTERQQIKWLALGGAVAGVAVPSSPLLYVLIGASATNIIVLLSVATLPLAAGVAIARHRLYDVDVVINRALVYAALTVTLAAAYLGTVLLLQLALSAFTDASGLAIAVSTLATAAIFRPLRSRIQHAVDRRFFRRRYDAALTLERFGARLRDEVDLDALAGELRTAAADALQPAHVSLWLREAVR